MTPLMISDELADELKQLAENERTSIDSILRALIDVRRQRRSQSDTALQAMAGFIKEDIPDASQSIKETITAHLLKREEEREHSD